MEEVNRPVGAWRVGDCLDLDVCEGLLHLLKERLSFEFTGVSQNL